MLNIFINDLLLLISEADVCNFADVTTLYKCGRDLELVSHKLEMDANIAITWLKNNEMVANLKRFWQEIRILKGKYLFPRKH